MIRDDTVETFIRVRNGSKAAGVIDPLRTLGMAPLPSEALDQSESFGSEAGLLVEKSPPRVAKTSRARRL